VASGAVMSLIKVKRLVFMMFFMLALPFSGSSLIGSVP